MGDIFWTIVYLTICVGMIYIGMDLWKLRRGGLAAAGLLMACFGVAGVALLLGLQ